MTSNAIVYTDDETAVSPDATPNLGGTDDYNGTTPPANLTGTLAHSYGADGAGSTCCSAPVRLPASPTR